MRTFNAIILVAAVMTASSTAARADFFDVVGKVGRVAEAVNDSHQQLAEGKLPTAALKGVGGKKGSGGRSKKHK